MCQKADTAFFMLVRLARSLRFVGLYTCRNVPIFRAPRRLPNVPGRFAKCSPALWKTSPIASVSTVTPFDRAAWQLHMHGGNRSCR